MNNKGFTLVELLATIVILGIVMGIATYGVISAIDSSKKKSEEVFVSKFASAIESYLALKGDKLGVKEVEDGSSSEQKFIELNYFTLNDLASENLIDKDKFINPRNKKNCYNEDAVIRAFRDDQFVYYYYFDFTQLSECLVEVENKDNENNEDIEENEGKNESELVAKYKSNSSNVADYVEGKDTGSVDDIIDDGSGDGESIEYEEEILGPADENDEEGYEIVEDNDE